MRLWYMLIVTLNGKGGKGNMGKIQVFENEKCMPESEVREVEAGGWEKGVGGNASLKKERNPLSIKGN